jgi:hypothetical protein
MNPLLWLQAALLALLALALLIGALRIAVRYLNALDTEPTYRTADGHAIARDMRILRRNVPVAEQRIDQHAVIRLNAQMVALADSISGMTTANPQAQGSLERWVWQSTYNHSRAMYGKS